MAAPINLMFRCCSFYTALLVGNFLENKTIKVAQKYLARHSVLGRSLAVEKMRFGLPKIWSIGIYSLFCIKSMHKLGVGGFSERSAAAPT